MEPYVDWPSYHGSDTGNRHSPLDRIHRGNVRDLALQWFYPIPDMPMLEGTPVVIAGVMYVNLYTNSVVALRPRTGEMEWYFQFTPHDTHDWDAQEPLLLIDEQFRAPSRRWMPRPASRSGTCRSTRTGRPRR